MFPVYPCVLCLMCKQFPLVVQAGCSFRFFHQYDFVGRWLNPGRPTVGALDLGGASTQITFFSQEEVEDLETSMTLRLYGQNYTLYTHSYLCYGKAEALRRLLAHLLTVHTEHHLTPLS